MGDGEGTPSVEHEYAQNTGLDPLPLLSLILACILGDRLNHAQFTDEKTEDQRDEGIALDPTEELGGQVCPLITETSFKARHLGP